MKKSFLINPIVLLSVLAVSVWAVPTPGQRERQPQPGAGRPADPFSENFFPPDLVMQAGAMIGLSDDQKEQIKKEMEQMREQMQNLQEQLKADREKLGEMTKPDHLEEANVLTQSDKVLEGERSIKQAQLSFLIRIKNVLTPAQQEQLKEHKVKTAGLRTKMARLQMTIGQAQQEGREVPDLKESREELFSLMSQGKFKEAEALVDKALEKLNTASRK